MFTFMLAKQKRWSRWLGIGRMVPNGAAADRATVA